MESLDSEARVFKLVGPVLVRQEVDEARANVQSRMDLLKRQVCVGAAVPSPGRAAVVGCVR